MVMGEHIEWPQSELVPRWKVDIARKQRDEVVAMLQEFVRLWWPQTIPQTMNDLPQIVIIEWAERAREWLAAHDKTENSDG